MQINALPKQSRPREKLLTLGPTSLTDAELLAIFIRTGVTGMNAIELAESLLLQSGSLQRLFNSSQHDLVKLKGVGDAKYVQFQAVLELCKRYLKEGCCREVCFDNPKRVYDYLCIQLKGLEHEVFMALYLDSQNQLITDEVLFNGTINAASVYPREVIKAALKHNAAGIIFAHNHPSGICEPSCADKVLTEKLQKALSLLDIKVLDHIIVAGNRHVSFAQMGLL
ncbi:DNA repair protein RadC [Pseudoalteromonas sp. SMS1]|uniref:RadC family protein n=1 Tax=Pseudoalteromonas sp. SMS1 TaxID=2908894 RepID=UPI001F385512|nr:DNA repair protein RadC [Pseudoalteromonas sp. SMS1]MCF2857539.1 DNA repair protein RadC [Pseudoalteromonas sp. SMS1]